MKKKNAGFTLLEILLVVAAIAILAGIVIIAINPTKQLGDARNAQRWSNVNTLSNAIYQHAIDNKGAVPASITTSSTEICANASSTVCTNAGLINLNTLLANEKYLVGIPVDPSGSVSTSTEGAGYFVQKTVNNRISVTAPEAEQGMTIGVSR